jgi:hypothetical protein
MKSAAHHCGVQRFFLLSGLKVTEANLPQGERNSRCEQWFNRIKNPGPFYDLSIKYDNRNTAKIKTDKPKLSASQ